MDPLHDPEHHFRFLDAVGAWTGGTTRDDQVPLGRLSSKSVVPGMSGRPAGFRVGGADRGTADRWRVGMLLAESFLPGPISDTITDVLRRAEAEHVPVWVGLSRAVRSIVGGRS